MSRAQPSGIAALLSDYRQFAGGRMWVALALMILGSLAEGFGLLMIVPLASIAIGQGDPRLLRFAPSAGGWTGDQRLVAALALFVAAMAARSALLFIRDVLLARLAAEYEANLRLRAAATLASRGWPFASRIGQAGMQSLLLSDVPRAAQAISHVQSMAVGGTMLIVALALALILSPTLTLVAVLFLASAYLLSRRITRRGVTSGFAISEAMDAAAGSGFRLHAALKAALAQGTISAFIAEYQSGLDRSARQYTRFARDYSYARHSAALGAALAAAALLLVGVRVLALPFPVLVASLVVFARMSGPAQLLQSNALQAAAAAPAFASIQGRLGTLRQQLPAALLGAPLEWRRVELDSVAFEHQPGLGLNPTSLTVKRGAWIGIRGPTGAGKTTLVDLAAGLLEPERGTVSIDGRPLKDALDGWRASIAYVAQEGIVFSDTVRGNLLAEGAVADDVALWQALETVGLGARVRALPAGLNENVGDRGSQLSGGERQRLVLARALLRRPSLLILDEATAALDPESEAQLVERLKAAKPRPAALVVAHRESSLSHCDSVISIQHGTVQAAG